MNDDIHDEDTTELHRRNINALAYLDRLKADDEERERNKGAWTERCACCAAIVLLNAAIWWALWQVFSSLTYFLK